MLYARCNDISPWITGNNCRHHRKISAILTYLDALRQVITLSAAQFIIELRNLPKARDVYPHQKYESISRPLLSDEEQTYPPRTVKTRPRSKSKPDDIFIHPTQSNIARADAVALEMGLGGETERVQANTYPREESGWEVGKGRDMARELLLGSKEKKKSRESFYINDSDSDSSQR
uniref:Uncharacterized protein n=1 Tax=Psilocybe cubensis TaxID=181762 RepID=A0A8H7Y9U1_PSICU